MRYSYRGQVFVLKFLSVAALAAYSLPAVAQTDSAAAFGAREGIEDIALSPDGKQIAFIAPIVGPGNGLFIVPVDKAVPPRRIANASGAPEKLRRCQWVTNVRLVCLIDAARRGAGMVLTGSRWIALDSDAKNLKKLWGDVVDLLVDEHDGDILIGWQGFYSGVARLNTATLKTKDVGGTLHWGGYYLTDGAGKVRVAGMATLDGNYQGKNFKYLYHRAGAWEWSPLSTYDSEARVGFEPRAVDAVQDVVYGLRGIDGRKALTSVSLDGNLTEKVVLKRPDVDIENVLLLGRRGRVVGATYVTDRRENIYFDAALAKIRDALTRVFPPNTTINFTGATDDEATLLVRSSSDVEPGTYFLYDKATRRLERLILARPELAGRALSPVKSLTFTARDGTRIPAYLTLPPGSSGKGLPAIVMPHGGPESRDEFGFDWLAQYYADRGYAVLQPNFRGSAGYGDAWFAENGFRSWPTAIGDIRDAGGWLIAQGIADPARLAIVGWSYGGYAALQSAVTDPGLFKAVVAIAPISDLDALKAEYQGYGNQYLMRAYIGSGDVAREGSPARHAERFAVPALLFHGDLDTNVSIKQSRLMESRLRDAGKPVRLVVYPGLDHQLDDSAARADMLRQSDAFLRTSMGIR
jgi:dipeptidyl aminopeptidase/acylaminoacyl peptidase